MGIAGELDEDLNSISPVVFCECGEAAHWGRTEYVTVFWCQACQIRLAIIDPDFRDDLQLEGGGLSIAR